MTKFKIGEKEYSVKYTLRALFIFERLAKHQFELTSLMDNYILLYSVLLANNPEMEMTWDEFIDHMDSDPTLFTRLNEAIDRDTAKNAVFAEEEEEPKDNKKKSDKKSEKKG